ncbi:RNA polymerase I enhancer binding protein [Tilletia horrida]|nr:RNA polymerase I enhancer binding protein [Tilletia horrida]
MARGGSSSQASTPRQPRASKKRRLAEESQVQDEPEAAQDPAAIRTQRLIQTAIEKYRGWEKRDILIHNEQYGAVLRALKDEYGLVYKEGKFTHDEVEQISRAVNIYKQRNKMDDELLQRILVGKGRANTVEYKQVQKELVIEITTALNGTRPHPAVREFLQRVYREGAHQGRWTDYETEALFRSHERNGNRWSIVAEDVGRSGEDCRKRWSLMQKELTADGRTSKEGPWSLEEKRNLFRVVEELKEELGIDANVTRRLGEISGLGEDAPAFWNTVSARMREPRNASQCRARWHSETRSVNNGRMPVIQIGPAREQQKAPRFLPTDRVVLLDRIVASLPGPMAQESEINWSAIQDKRWHFPELQRKWNHIRQKHTPQDFKGSFKALCEKIRKRLVVEARKFEKRREGQLRRDEESQIEERKSRRRKRAAESSGADSDSEEDAAGGASTAAGSTGTPAASGAGRKVLGKRQRSNSPDSSKAQDSNSGGSSDGDDSSSDSDSDDSSSESDLGSVKDRARAIQKMGSKKLLGDAVLKNKVKAKSNGKGAKAQGKPLQVRKNKVPVHSDSSSDSDSDSDSDDSDTSSSEDGGKKAAAGRDSDETSSDSDSDGSSSDEDDDDSSSSGNSSDSDAKAKKRKVQASKTQKEGQSKAKVAAKSRSESSSSSNTDSDSDSDSSSSDGAVVQPRLGIDSDEERSLLSE